MPDVTTNPVADVVRGARRRLHAHPYARDGLIALGAFLVVLVSAAAGTRGEAGAHGRHGRYVHSLDVHPLDVHPLTAVLAAVACSALVLRRRAPMPVLCVATALTVLGLITDSFAGTPAEEHRAPIVIVAIIALYTVSNRTDRVTGLRVGAVTVCVLTGSAMLLSGRSWYDPANFAVFAWSGLAAAAGEAVRSRRAFVDAIRERAERAERTREEEARRRVAEERMRIARELHDVVAHHIALVNVQAGVASHVMDQRPDQAKEALAHVREASRHALDELQATVGLLRQSGESTAPTEPAPGLGVLDELVEDFTRAGMSVSVSVSAGERPSDGTEEDQDAGTAAGEAVAGALSSAIDLTAYRVVQEALTNVQKHVGSRAHAQVRIAAGPSALEVTVTDDGVGDADGGPAGARDGLPRGAAPGREGERGPDSAAVTGGAGASAGTGGGHGLIGMRERAAALHGVCETGPLPDGGFRVHVRLPLQRSSPDPDPGDGTDAGTRTDTGAGSRPDGGGEWEGASA